MESFELLYERFRKKSSVSAYSLEKNRIKSEFLLMCKKYLCNPNELLVFSPSTQRDLSTFLDIVDDEDIKMSYIISQAEDNVFHVEMRDLNIL